MFKVQVNLIPKFINPNPINTNIPKSMNSLERCDWNGLITFLAKLAIIINIKITNEIETKTNLSTSRIYDKQK